MAGTCKVGFAGRGDESSFESNEVFWDRVSMQISYSYALMKIQV